jgi:exodeoxyribonuclease VIII
VTLSQDKPTFGLVQMTNAEYHAAEGISKSHLDLVRRSPLHYWQGYVNPDRGPRPHSPVFVLGSAIHSAILEPDLFPVEFIVMPEDAPKPPTELQLNPRKGAPKLEHLEAAQWWDEFTVKTVGKTIITVDQHATALGCRDSVFKHPKARALLARGLAEQTYIALDPITGARIKARPDWTTISGAILDVKSTMDASPDGFGHSVRKFRYHVQQPWYQDCIEAALDAEVNKEWHFLAVEKFPPYACALYTLPQALVRAGRKAMHADLQTILNCRASGTWPGYGDDSTELPLKPWEQAEDEATTPEEDFA